MSLEDRTEALSSKHEPAPRSFRKLLRDSRVYDWLNQTRNLLSWILWLAGRRDRVPHFVKRRVLRAYAARWAITSFVETGTYFGDMVNGLKRDFSKIQSIELDPYLAQRARRRFTRYPHVTILQGDSATMLPIALASIDVPTLFWLDAHYSGGITAQSDGETPILTELEHILSHRVIGHVVIIDDAGLFGTDPSYPTLEVLRSFVQKIGPEWRMEVRHDSVRLVRGREVA